MDNLIEGTPISIVQQVDVCADIECEIYPVHLSHTRRIDQLLKSDPFFNGIDFSYDTSNGCITSVICKFDYCAVSVLVEKLPYIEARINDTFDLFIAESQSYHAIKA